MASVRRPGMDHELYAYVPLPARAPLAWPDRRPVALWICLHLEYWELDPPPGARHPPGIEGTWQIFAPDYRTFAHREYGNRIGVFRVLDALDEHAFPVTVAVNAEVCRRYPQLVQECSDRGFEIAAGGTHATRMISSAMTTEDEIAHIEEAKSAVRDATGIEPVGWIGQDFGESARTPFLVAERGFRYIADWPNDEQPYWMSTTPRLVSVPQQTEWDDVNLLWLRQIATPRFPRLVEDALARLIADGSHSGRTFVLNVHPWLFGQPHRIRYLRESLRALAASPEVWRTTARDIAAHFASHLEERAP
jgi:peptidoglycan/xylan/chitin deacetylase (PgdA/CDA1 family)